MYSEEVEKNLQELVDHAVKVNKVALHAIKPIEYKTVLNNARIALECICKGILFVQEDSYSSNLNGQINHLYASNYILESKKDQFHRLRALGNLGSHSTRLTTELTIDEVKEARQLLNDILTFFYVQILDLSIPKKLHTAMQATPLKDLQIRDKSLYTGEVLNDVPLSEIYVLPRVLFWKNTLTSNNHSQNFNSIPSVSDLHQFVEDFICNKLEQYEEIKYPSSQALIILGAPGQGKTSFCKRVLYDFIGNEAHSISNTYYVKLRDIHNSDFLAKPFSYLIEEKFFPETTEKNLEEALIIFDGLDELYLHNGGQILQVDAFIQTLLQQLKAPRYAKTKLIISSRFGYLSLDKLDYENNVSIACIDTFDENQQIEWVENYQKAFPDKEIQLNADKIREIHTKPLYLKQPLIHFQELFEQPVLLHLFVLSDLEVNINTQRTQIYSQLFEKLSKRAWEKEPSQALKRVDSLQLKEIAKAIAFEMYKNKQTFLNKKALDNIPEVEGFYTTLDIRGEEQKKELYRYLFIAFYWQKKNNTEGQVLEFLHKSLQEYLIAEKIWDEFQKIATDSCPSPSHALEAIWSFAAPQMIPKEVREILVEIIDNDSKNHSSLLEKMKAYFPDLLKKQFMQECLPVEPIKGAVHCFYLYFLVLNTLHFKVYSSMDVEEPVYLSLKTSDWSVSNLFQITQLYYSRVYWNLNCCTVYSYMQFSYSLFFSKIEAVKFEQIGFHDITFHKTSFNQSILDQVSINKVNLNGSTFKQAQFYGVKGTEVKFHQNDCTGITIRKSHFITESTMSFCLFTSATIIDSHFKKMNISQSSFEGANFHEEKEYYWQFTDRSFPFEECTFSGCSFDKANLTQTSFRKTKITGSSFEGVNITETNFSGATLDLGHFPKNFNTITTNEDYHIPNIDKLTCFDNAFGKRASFQEATLKGVSFKNAELEQVNFSNATIKSYYNVYNSKQININLNAPANFENASLIKANFKNAKLRGANFDYAILKNTNFSRAKIQSNLHEYYDSLNGEEKKKIIYSSFKKSDLECASFNCANLSDIDFQEANFENANFNDSTISNCNFSNSNLKGANFTSSTLENTNFEGADLSDTKWDYSIYSNYFNNQNTETDQGQYLQTSPKKPKNYKVYWVFKNILEQLKTVKSLYNTKGIHPEWKEWLIKEGFQHLFEAPKNN